MKKILIFSMIVLVLALAFFSTSLFVPTPPKTEAMFVNWWLMIEIMCDECKEQWSLCCQDICYNKYLKYSYTDNNKDKLREYKECMDTCPTTLARGCSGL